MSHTLFNQLLYAWMALGVITFFYLLRQNAPYGRHVRPGWGPTIDNRLGWMLMEVVVMIFFLSAFLGNGGSSSQVVWVLSACFLFHYTNRSLVFPFRLRTKGKRMPLAIVFSAVGFNLANGFFLGYYFARFADYPADWFADWRFIIGMAVFIAGMAINWHSDHILIHLRPPGAQGYFIPQGGLFRWISCPNHFGEIVEWCGFALMSWSLPGAAFALWTIANLAPRALAHHRWYQEHFPDYPKERKALFPL